MKLFLILIEVSVFAENSDQMGSDYNHSSTFSRNISVDEAARMFRLCFLVLINLEELSSDISLT